MDERVNHRRNARTLRVFSLLYVVSTAAALMFVHADSYKPAVSYLVLYMVAAFGITAAVVMVLLPAELFTNGFSGGVYGGFALSSSRSGSF